MKTNRLGWFAVLLAAVVWSTGCAQPEKKAAAHDHAEHAEHEGHDAEHDGHAAEHGGGHAPAGAVPGSYEDWCAEHAVPESACTRCNPELIPAFKATNDWCPEHGIPESQCKDCNPNLVIQRPPKPGS